MRELLDLPPRATPGGLRLSLPPSGAAAPDVPAERIIAAVARYCEVTPGETKGHMRLRHFTRPRHLAMWLVRGLTGASYPAIGRRFGGRDHGTVMHACRRVDQRLGRRDPLAVWREISEAP